jgi:hypothetical protein
MVREQYAHDEPCDVAGRKWHVEYQVEKYENGGLIERKVRQPGLRGFFKRRQSEWIAPEGLVPDEIVSGLGNLLVNAGIQRLEDQLIGATTAPYNNTNCRLGVGNVSTAAVATDTDLGAAAGAANRQFVLMDATFPSRAGQVITFRATFTGGLANFVWAEWALDIGTANGTTVTAPMLNHKISALGTKVSGAQWVFTVTVTIS